MTWIGIKEQVVTDLVDQLGESATWSDGTSLEIILTRRAEPVMRAGQIVIDEDHYDGRIDASALDTDPAMDDTVTLSDGTVYRVDVPPEYRDGMWALTLRKVTA